MSRGFFIFIKFWIYRLVLSVRVYLFEIEGIVLGDFLKSRELEKENFKRVNLKEGVIVVGGDICLRFIFW